MDKLILPKDLKERRSVLEEELGKVVKELVTNEIKNKINKYSNEYNLGIKSVIWGFHAEYNDEGGTDYYPTIYSIIMDDKRDPEEIIIEVKFKSEHSDCTYEYNLYELISDILLEHSDDLYKYDIEEINL